MLCVHCSLCDLQFALPGAVEDLRRGERDTTAESRAPLVVSLRDPAYVMDRTLADAIEEPDAAALLSSARRPGSYVVMSGGAPVLLVEEGYAGHGRAWHATQVRNLLRSVTRAGVLVEHVSASQTSTRLAELVKYSLEEHHTLDKIVPIQPTRSYWNQDERDAVAFLMGLPGIGETLARALLKDIETPADIILAFLWRNERKLLAVPRIGKGTVERVSDFLWKEIV